MNEPRLVGLNVYPLKSGRGIACESAVVEERGLRHDRRWMIIDQNGDFLSQRSEPRLALLEAGLSGGPTGDEGAIVLRTESLPDLHVPTPPTDTTRLPTTIWTDQVDARVAGAEANAWLSEFLGQTVWLAWMPDDAQRPTALDASVSVSFADGYPYLLCSESSHRDLNERLDTPVSMDRFRANLLIDGIEAWAEDRWRRLRIGVVEFEAINPCARCIMVTTDQQSGERRGPEPLQTLSKFRRSSDGKVLFGINLIARGNGMLQVGDPFEILA